MGRQVILDRPFAEVLYSSNLGKRVGLVNTALPNLQHARYERPFRHVEYFYLPRSYLSALAFAPNSLNFIAQDILKGHKKHK
jgi:hypothetical protein